MKPLFLVASLILVSACGPTASATPTLPPPVIASATNTPIPVASATALPALTPVGAPTPAEPITLQITAADGTILAASYYAPAVRGGPAAGGQAAVLLLHMLGRTRADWDTFARELQKYGIAALALDLRGHGQSGGAIDWAKAPDDVRAAWDGLVARAEVDRTATAIVGASIGANLALIAGANNPEVRVVIALSPGLDYRGVQPAAQLSQLGQRPVFFLASQNDAYAYDSVKQMAGQAAAGETYYFKNAGHGTDMFNDATLQPLLLDWLTQKLGVVKG